MLLYWPPRSRSSQIRTRRAASRDGVVSANQPVQSWITIPKAEVMMLADSRARHVREGQPADPAGPRVGQVEGAHAILVGLLEASFLFWAPHFRLGRNWAVGVENTNWSECWRCPIPVNLTMGVPTEARSDLTVARTAHTSGQREACTVLLARPKPEGELQAERLSVQDLLLQCGFGTVQIPQTDRTKAPISTSMTPPGGLAESARPGSSPGGVR
jgi:hypothetical protein